MADIIATGTSGYVTGSIDTATVLVNNVSPIDAKHPNGCAAAAVQIETILGVGTTLKGNKADLVARLAVSIDADGFINSTGSAASITKDASRTNTNETMLTLTATSTVSPAAGIGTAILLRAESADENPSDFGMLAATASDVGAGTEDTYLSWFARVAGAALTEVYRFVATGAFKATFTHGNTADRTYTLQNSSDVIVMRDTTDTLTNKTLTSPIVTGNTIGTGALKTSTGSAAGTVSSGNSVDIDMNDYSFFPMIRGQGTHILRGQNIADPSDTIGRFSIFDNGICSTTAYTVRWRYVTASDDPVIWVVVDPVSGWLMHVWASDDPVPGGGPGIRQSGYTSVQLKAKDLEHLTILDAKAQDAADKIRDKGWKNANQAYRALQLVAADDAPSLYLLENFKVNAITKRLEYDATLKSQRDAAKGANE